MNKKLIKELNQTETYHWWHIAKKNIIAKLANKYLSKSYKKETRQILEIGAGAGNILASFNNTGITTAVDSDNNAVEFCKQKKIQNIIHNTFEKVDLKTNTYDLIIAADILEHIENDANAINKMYSILKPNGILILHVPANNNLYSYWDKQLDHYRRYSINDIYILVKKSKFNIKFISYRIVLPYIFIKIFRRIKSISDKNSSDFTNFKILNNILLRYITFEDTIILNGLKPHFGLSIIAVLIK